VQAIFEKFAKGPDAKAVAELERSVLAEGGTVVITGPRGLDFFAGFCAHHVPLAIAAEVPSAGVTSTLILYDLQRDLIHKRTSATPVR
jgi:hypothetical protein